MKTFAIASLLVLAPMAYAESAPGGHDAMRSDAQLAKTFLVAFSRDGLAKFTPGGTSVAPTLTRTQVI